MREALRLAAKANAADEVPIGAVVVRAGQVIGRAYNQVELLKDATAHAELLALPQAHWFMCAYGAWFLAARIPKAAEPAGCSMWFNIRL